MEGGKKLACVSFFDDFGFLATSEQGKVHLWNNPFGEAEKEFAPKFCGSKICSLSERNIDFINKTTLVNKKEKENNFCEINSQKEIVFAHDDNNKIGLNIKTKEVICNFENLSRDNLKICENNKNENREKSESLLNVEEEIKERSNILNDPKINNAFDKIIDQLDKLNKTTEIMSKRIDINDKNILEITRFIKKDIDSRNVTI